MSREIDPQLYLAETELSVEALDARFEELSPYMRFEISWHALEIIAARRGGFSQEEASRLINAVVPDMPNSLGIDGDFQQALAEELTGEWCDEGESEVTTRRDTAIMISSSSLGAVSAEDVVRESRDRSFMSLYGSMADWFPEGQTENLNVEQISGIVSLVSEHFLELMSAYSWSVVREKTFLDSLQSRIQMNDISPIDARFLFNEILSDAIDYSLQRESGEAVEDLVPIGVGWEEAWGALLLQKAELWEFQIRYPDCDLELFFSQES